MNKDLEKIIHETAREIAVEIISNSRLEKPPTPDYRDVVINFASKVSSEVAMRVHTETQKLIDESKLKSVLTVGCMVTAKDVGMYGKIESITASGVLVSFGGVIESKLYSGDDVNFIM